MIRRTKIGGLRRREGEALYDDVFVGAHARERIGAADDLGQPLRHRLEQLVADGMA
jgi:hypothetical protein